MSTAGSSHDHGNCELCDQIEAQLAEVTRQRESYERASLVLIQQLADRDRALAALRGQFDAILRELGSDTEPSVWSKNALAIAKAAYLWAAPEAP